MEEQAKRRHGEVKPREVRRFDQTQLKPSALQHVVHRDYAAHFFRWGFARRFVTGRSRVLDVGCGQELPLVHTLGQQQSFMPAHYTGVDLNKIKPLQRKWVTLYPETDFTAQYKKLFKPASFDLIFNFEMIEHMSVNDGKKLLAGLYHCLTPRGTLLLSTPVFNGQAARNHIHEYTVAELQRQLENAGFKVYQRWGTFASYHDIKKVLPPAELHVLERLRQWYDNDVAACFLAPHYPDASRNNCWVLLKR